MTADNEYTPMTLTQVAPELRAPISKMPPIPIGNKLGRWFIRKAMNFLVREKDYDGVSIEKRMLSKDIEIHIYTPEQALTDAGLLWIHGGGLVIGSAKQDHKFCADTARELGIIVVSTEYRLAPESPFPAALDDCHTAWMWLQASASELNIDATRIAIGGQSAGGGLAAGLVQRIHDDGGIQPRAQWLFCPMLDDRTALRYELDDINHFIWNNQNNRIGWHAYLGIHFGSEQTPAYAVPARRDDLTGLPSAWIGTGDIELFFVEDKTYAERLMASGVDCLLHVVEGGPHGFESIAPHTKLAQDYLAQSRAWLASFI
ncbi:MAG: alpha/beta hydrolase [Anaerolineae bacterium]